jgi:cobalt/nickel transport protein
MKMKKSEQAILTVLMTAACTAHAHFQVLVPSTDIVEQSTGREITLDLVFTHPMENGPVMEMGTPVQFGVLAREKKTDLRDALKEKKLDGKTAYLADYTVRTPGDHVFFIEPAPYWEPAEEKMIVHYTKVIVNAFGDESGWDTMVGFPVEIEPLTRPYGLWTGNTFRGIVKRNGKPVPFAEIEVEYRNDDETVKPPADAYITQVIKADTNGTFCYAMPLAGWWSFAALVDGDQPMKNPEGKAVDVELGALIWVHCRDMR